MSDIPQPLDALLHHAGALLHGSVVTTDVITGGYTPQQLRRLTLADGRRAVLKAAPPVTDPTLQSGWATILRREICVYRELSILTPWQPHYLGDFEHEGWVVLLMEDLSEAQRVLPWTPTTTAAVAQSLAAMHAATLGSRAPAIVHPPLSAPPFFQQILARGHAPGDLPTAWDHPAWWHWLEQACLVGNTVLMAPREDQLRCVIHFDVRSDNLFLRDGHLVLIDWSDPMWETPAFDSVYWALGVEVEGGAAAGAVHDHYLHHAPPLPTAAIQWTLAFITGYFIDTLHTGGVAPRLSDLRQRFLRVTLPWFAQIFDLPTPPVV